MCLNVKDFFLKKRYIYRQIYLILIVITNQKPTIDTQEQKRKEHMHTIKGNHQMIKEETTRRKKTGKDNKTKGKTCDKMAISIYLSIIIIKINGPHAPLRSQGLTFLLPLSSSCSDSFAVSEWWATPGLCPCPFLYISPVALLPRTSASMSPAPVLSHGSLST